MLFFLHHVFNKHSWNHPTIIIYEINSIKIQNLNTQKKKKKTFTRKNKRFKSKLGKSKIL